MQTTTCEVGTFVDRKHHSELASSASATREFTHTLGCDGVDAGSMESTISGGGTSSENVVHSG